MPSYISANRCRRASARLGEASCNKEVSDSSVHLAALFSSFFFLLYYLFWTASSLKMIATAQKRNILRNHETAHISTEGERIEWMHTKSTSNEQGRAYSDRCHGWPIDSVVFIASAEQVGFSTRNMHGPPCISMHVQLRDKHFMHGMSNEELVDYATFQVLWHFLLICPLVRLCLHHPTSCASAEFAISLLWRLSFIMSALLLHQAPTSPPTWQLLIF